MHEPKLSFGPSAAKTSLPSGNGERAADSSSRFHKAAPMPATAPEHPLTLSPNASAKPRVCGIRNRPSRLAGPRASHERSEPSDAAWESSHNVERPLLSTGKSLRAGGAVTVR